MKTKESMNDLSESYITSLMNEISNGRWYSVEREIYDLPEDIQGALDELATMYDEYFKNDLDESSEDKIIAFKNKILSLVKSAEKKLEETVEEKKEKLNENINNFDIKVTINGKSVYDITPYDLDKLFEKAGYTDNGIIQTRFIGMRNDELQFLVLSDNSNEDEWLVSMALISEASAEFLGSPIEIFERAQEDEAIKFFNEYKAKWL